MVLSRRQAEGFARLQEQYAVLLQRYYSCPSKDRHPYEANLVVPKSLGACYFDIKYFLTRFLPSWVNFLIFLSSGIDFRDLYLIFSEKFVFFKKMCKWMSRWRNNRMENVPFRFTQSICKQRSPQSKRNSKDKNMAEQYNSIENYRF